MKREIWIEPILIGRTLQEREFPQPDRVSWQDDDELDWGSLARTKKDGTNFLGSCREASDATYKL
jgi:hypothetical protein